MKFNKLYESLNSSDSTTIQDFRKYVLLNKSEVFEDALNGFLRELEKTKTSRIVGFDDDHENSVATDAIFGGNEISGIMDNPQYINSTTISNWFGSVNTDLGKLSAYINGDINQFDVDEMDVMKSLKRDMKRVREIVSDTVGDNIIVYVDDRDMTDEVIKGTTEYASIGDLVGSEARSIIMVDVPVDDVVLVDPINSTGNNMVIALNRQSSSKKEMEDRYDDMTKTIQETKDEITVANNNGAFDDLFEVDVNIPDK